MATKNRERVLAVEDEAVKKERELQIIEREREAQLKSIERDREVETEQKEVAQVRRDRIAVDKTVAEEEENIATLRKIKAADREKEASVIAAEGRAEEKLIANIKAAEAAEKVAQHEAKERVVRADAEVEAAERIARAKKQEAEGVQAEQAASGLAKVQVREANAQALEKEGLVEAKVIETKGRAQAATMIEHKTAEAEGIKKKLLAEAEGLVEKARSIDAFSEKSLAHEEYRLELEWGEKLGLEKIAKALDIARAQSDVLGEAMKTANVNIVGGNDGFYENFIRSISAGHMVEGFLESSPAASGLFEGMMKRVKNGSTNGDGLVGGGGSSSRGGGDRIKLTEMLDAVRSETDGEGQAKIDDLIEMLGTSLDESEGSETKEVDPA